MMDEERSATTIPSRILSIEDEYQFWAVGSMIGLVCVLHLAMRTALAFWTEKSELVQWRLGWGKAKIFVLHLGLAEKRWTVFWGAGMLSKVLQKL